MLRSTRKEIPSKAFMSNCAGVIAICILLLATTVIIPQGSVYNGLLPSAFAQQGEEDEEEQERQEQDEEGAAEEEEGLPTAETISAELADEEEEEATDLPTAEIISNGTEGIAPATFEFEANITGGTEPYTISWDFDDEGEESNEETVLHTFEEAGTYNVNLTATDSEDQTASDSIEINVEEPGAAEEEVTEPGAAEEVTEPGAAEEEVTSLADLKETAA